MTEKITIGDVIQRLEKELFPNPQTKVETLCKEREDSIKQYLEITHHIIIQNINFRRDYHGKIPFWKNARIGNHIKNLSNYTELLALELDKERIEGHCAFKDKFMFEAFKPDFMFLMLNTVHGNILSDIMWAGDITISDAMELSAGQLDLSQLGKYLPQKIKNIREDFISYIEKSRYKRHLPTIHEVLKCADLNLNRACNLLLMTTIEGIERDLASFLNKMQGLNYDLSSDKFNSLDSLLRKGEWIEDYEISKTELELLTGVKNPIVFNYSIPLDFNELGVLDDKIKVNLKTRLDFLRRRFKEDRDMILHGVNSEYGSEWHLFVNFSALGQVFRTLQYYDQLYKE